MSLRSQARIGLLASVVIAQGLVGAAGLEQRKVKGILKKNKPAAPPYADSPSTKATSAAALEAAQKSAQELALEVASYAQQELNVSPEQQEQQKQQRQPMKRNVAGQGNNNAAAVYAMRFKGNRQA